MFASEGGRLTVLVALLGICACDGHNSPASLNLSPSATQYARAVLRTSRVVPLRALRGGNDEDQKNIEDGKKFLVAFKRLARVNEGETLFVVGDCVALGSAEPANAIPMKNVNGTNIWEAEVPEVPMDVQYQYFAARPDDVEGTARYQTGYKLFLRECDHQKEKGKLIADDTLQLVRFTVRKTGGDMKVTGSLKELGEWDITRAPSMTKCGEHNKWELVIKIPADELNQFQYKYVADGKHEAGNNRWSDADWVEPQPEEMGMVSTLEAVFEGTLIRFLIFHPVGPDERMVITGSHPGLGMWDPIGNPRKMGLGNVRTLLTGVRDRCWETTFAAPQEDWEKVTYRYIIRNEKEQSSVWESEPNRFIDFIPGADSASREFRQREWTRFDGNFVAKKLQFDFVPPNLFVGPYPQCKDDVDKMKEAGVTGVMNVQTEEDIRKREVNMQMMKRLYDDAGIELVHLPILDFHGDDLAARVKYASREVDRLAHNRKHEGKEGKIYIHCTAGMGRAPAVACIYLVHKHGYTLEQAMAHVKHHRPVVAPNYEAMKKAIRNGLDN